MFASAHPSDVAGMVLDDASSEAQDTRLLALLPEDRRNAMRASFGVEAEGVDYNAFVGSMAQVRASNRSLGDKPLVVLTHGRPEPQPELPPDVRSKMEGAWQELQAELPQLSTNAVQLVATNSGHYVHRDAPRLFVTAVRSVVDAVRAHAPIDRNALNAAAAKAAAFTPERALERLFTQAPTTDWFAPPFVREAPPGQLERIPSEVSAGLGAFKKVTRDGARFVVEFEKGSVPAEARVDEDGRFVMLFFHPTLRAPEPPSSAAPTGSAKRPPKPAH